MAVLSVSGCLDVREQTGERGPRPDDALEELSSDRCRHGVRGLVVVAEVQVECAVRGSRGAVFLRPDLGVLQTLQTWELTGQVDDAGVLRFERDDVVGV